MTVLLSPVFNNDASQTDSAGAPRSGAHLHTYLAGTSTPATTYQNYLGSGVGGVAHTNPIILNANGLPPAPIWLTQGTSSAPLTYKFVLAPSTDTTPPVSAILTVDNITPINDVADVVSTEWTPSGMTATRTSNTTFTVTGDQTTTFNVGRRLKCFTTSSGTVYATITKSTFTSLTTVTVENDSGTLDSGINSGSGQTGGVLYGIVSAANTSLPFLSRDQQCGRLGYVSATSIRLDPQDGNTIWVYTAAAGWARRAIPSAGITAANTSVYVNGTSGQSLAATTTYYVYLFDNSGTLTMDFSTTAPAVDATSGLYIKTGVATRLLIGMVRTQGSTPGQFQANGIGVLSWYKRRAIQVTGAALSAASTNSTSYIELQNAAIAKFLAWAEEAIHAVFIGDALTDSNAQTATNAVHLDGIVGAGGTLIGAAVGATTYINLAQVNLTCGGFATVTDGYHYVTLAAKVNAGTGTWTNGGRLQVLTQG